MLDLLLSLVTGQVGVSLRRFARAAAFAALTLVFALVALVAAAAAVFLELDALFGPLRAALIVAAGAAVLAFLFSLPLWARRQPPPPSRAGTLVEVALAIGLGLMAERKGKNGARGN